MRKPYISATALARERVGSIHTWYLVPGTCTWCLGVWSKASIQYTVYSIQYTVYSIQYTIYSISYLDTY